MNAKTCTKCKNNKKLTDFFKDKSKKDSLRPSCKQCSNEVNKRRPDRLEKMKLWRVKNKEAVKHNDLKTAFGIGLVEYNKMLLEQQDKCAICKNPETAFIKSLNKTKSFSVDHCHKTGRIRGLLCGKCNTALGLFKEDVSIMKLAINYLIQNGDNNDTAS